MSAQATELNVFRTAMKVVSNGDKTVDKSVRPLIESFMLTGNTDEFQANYDDAVAEYAQQKSNKTAQAKVSRAWALASKRMYFHLGEAGFRFSAPSIRSGGKVEITTIAEERRNNAAETQKKADVLNASITASNARSEAARLEKMQSATPESIADDIRQTLELSGISLASVARILYQNDEWSKFVRDVNQLASVASQATAIEVESPTLETC